MNPDALDMHTIWIGALLAIPVAAVVSLVCKTCVRVPATRHALWVVALLTFIAPSVVSMTHVPEWISYLRPNPIPATMHPGMPSESGAGLVERVHAVPAVEPRRIGESFEYSRDTRTGSSSATRASSPARPGAEFAPYKYTEDAGRTEASLIPTDAWSPDTPPADAGAEPILTRPRAARIAADEPTPMKPERHRGDATPAARRPASSILFEPAFIHNPEPESPGQAPTQTREIAESPTLSTLDRAHAQLAAWGAWFRGLGASLRTIPPVSGMIWLLGVLLATAFVAARIVLDQRALSRAQPPSPDDAELLRAAADQIGLRRPPGLRFVAKRVSPMVTCGPRRRLIIPRSLWDELDTEARLAVLLHELAHIRRRDHWTHWLSAAIGLLYWWHPLAWVVRSRLADEADLACDAWVTSLMPGRRRVYAAALLQATTFVSAKSFRPRPHAGASLAMAASSTRRLSRRLTMVMTHKVRPRLSAPGTSIVGILAVLALIVLPGVACPPDEKDAPKGYVEIHADSHDHADAPDDSTFDAHMRDRDDNEHGHVHPDHPDHPDHADHADGVVHLMDRMRVLEDRLGRLHVELGERLHTSVTGAGPRADHGPGAATADAYAPVADDAKIARAYVIPAGRLESLTALMVRSDVPVLVSPEDKRIVVHATSRNHQTFSQFAAMICPEGVTVIDLESGRRIQLSGASLRGFEFSETPRADVRFRTGGGAVLAAPKAPRVTVTGPGRVYADVQGGTVATWSGDDECEQECEDTCDGDCGDECDGCDGCAEPCEPDHAHHAAQAAFGYVTASRSKAENRVAFEAMHARLRELRQGQGRLAESLRRSADQHRVQENRVRQIERQAARLSEQAEHEHEKAHKYELEAAQILAEADARKRKGELERAQAMYQRVEQVHRQMEQRQQQAHAVQAESEASQAAAERAEHEAERFEETMERYEDALNDLLEEIETLEEELEELAEAVSEAKSDR